MDLDPFPPIRDIAEHFRRSAMSTTRNTYGIHAQGRDAKQPVPDRSLLQLSVSNTKMRRGGGAWIVEVLSPSF